MKTPFLPFSQLRTRLVSPSKTLLPAVLLLGLASSHAQAQSSSFPRNVTFKDAAASDFTFSGTARLTGTGQTGDDATGQGYLRLTSAEGNKAGSIIDNVGFDAPEGFTISFEFFAYGGDGADGFSVFLVDEAGQPATGFRIGASGGSLGYAQKTVTPIADGVSRGYIGIGIDEFGNYSNPTEGRNGGPGSVPDAVSIRGAGNGSSTTDYPYLAGTGLGQLGFSLDVPTARAQAGSPDYRRAFIDVIPVGTGASRTYNITVRIQHGTAVTTAVNQIQVSTPPDRLRLGFSGSTGGQINVHEIRNLNIVQAPFAIDDVASTIYNNPITLNVTSNDVAPGASIDRATVDLDIDAPGIQTTRTIANQGTFTVTNTGAVTFTPVSTFAGTVSLPYNVQDILSQVSSPANITVIVEGADVATSASGPNFATASSRITYSMSTTNLGTQPATNVVPKLRLSPSVSAVGMTLPTGATYNQATGEVTFATIANLAAGATAVTNQVSFNTPASGTLTGTASSVSLIPDPVTDNNTAVITTTIGGSVNVVTACATPGKDGPGTLDGTTAPNTYFPGTSSTTSGTTTFTIGAARTGTGASSETLSPGDLVLVMQIQGQDINTANSSAYGSLTPTGINTAGQYEYAVVTSFVGTTLTGGILTLATPLTKTYTNDDYSSSVSGQRRFQVIRVPQYSALTVSGTVTGAAWNGSTGGVLVLDVAGRTTMSGSASLSMTAKGFRGGGGKQYTGTTTGTYANTTFRNQAFSTLGAAHGSKGEGTAGTPQFVYAGGTTTIDAGAAEGYLDGSVGRGAPGNAGGGANDFTPISNSGNAGGAGGGNGGNGGTGGYGFGSNGSGNRSIGGAARTGAISNLVLGGGGGAGSTDATNDYLSSGGTGGGIIILRTGSVAGAGIVEANGGTAPSANANEGGGGGGAGGSVLLLASPPTGITGGTGLSNLTVSANGGNGSRGSNITNGPMGGRGLYGPGGGGGGGVVFANAPLSASTVVAGAAGLTVSTDAASTYGAAPGSNGTVTTNADVTTNDGAISGAGACLPLLTTTLETTTPRVTRTGDPGQPVNPASYTLRIANTGGIANNVNVIVALATNGVANNAGPFRYRTAGTTVVQRLSNGILNTLAAVTNYVAPTDNSINPTFSGLTIPAGATTTINFVANIAGTAQDNLPYQTTASVSYNDPTRTTATRRIAPAQFYEAGGEVPGSNYSGASSTAEDVTILRPLPVELKRFDAAAAGSNAELSWATASEMQNDHFDIERSLDGYNFERIGLVKGQGTSFQETAYRYTDAGVARLSLKPIYYRLRQVDRDGSSSYSPVRVVRFERGTKAAIALYPNPHQGTATLDLTALPSLESRVEVLDLSGRLLRKFQLIGGLEHSLDLNALPLGSYLVRVRSAETVITLPMIRN
ncbi:T9SS type A sorting domain-containing protein [Hymenobacter sp.]|jgi:hypothetical protein|uniref:T9SS type A sorting domain-containing protein n=1 Tax=Hymenobacter sp. TaxID=1898978 RepID=UPI002EDB9E71